MKRTLKSIVLALIMVFTLTGCTKSISYTFNVETGDKVKVELNTTDGYKLSSELPFTISKDDKTLSQGTFIKGEYYDTYVDAAKSDSLSTILDEGEKGEIEYVFYSYNDSEYNYVIKIKDSKTGVLLGNANSEKEAKECFDLLTFTLE